MADLIWKRSYETLKFDTPDGDLHDGQYAVYKGDHYVRINPENNRQWVVLEALDKPVDIPATIAGLTEVHVLDGETMYYDEYIMPDGRMYRELSKQKDYKDLAKVGASPKPTKVVTDKDVADIKSVDSLWAGKDVKLK